VAFDRDGERLFAAAGLAGVFSSADGGASWQPRNRGLTDPEGRQARVAGVTTDPVDKQRLYAFNGSFGGGYGLHRSSDAGANWTPIAQGLADDAGALPAIRDLLVSPQSPAELWLATSRGVYRSNDRGDLWTLTSAGIAEGNDRFIYRLARLRGRLYAGSTNGVFRWNDATAQWSQLLEEPFVDIRAFADVPGGKLLAAGDRGIFGSNDNGATWLQLPWFNSRPGISDLLVLPAAAPGAVPEVLAAYSSFSGGDIARSVDGGVNWAEPTPPSGSGSELNAPIRFALRPGSSPEVALAAGSGAFFSNDLGTTWQRRIQGLRAAGPIDAPRSVGERNTLLYPSMATLHRSEDFGASWADVGVGLAYRDVFSIAPASSDPQIVWATNTLFDTLKSMDGGKTWESFNVDGVGLGLSRVVAVHPQDPNIAVVGQFGGLSSFYDPYEGLWRTADGGATWQRSIAVPDNFQNFQPERALWDPDDPDSVYFAVHYRDDESSGFTDGGIFRSTDGGLTFTEVIDEMSFPEIARTGDGTLLAMGWTTSRRAGMWKSVDRGDTWQRVGEGALPEDRGLYFLATDPEAPQTVFASFSDEVLVSEDAGTTWSAVAVEGLPEPGIAVRSLAVLPSFPRRLLLGTDGGIYEAVLECVPSPTALCLEGGRFRVESQFTTPQGSSGHGRAVPLTPDTGTFWFFDPTNLELVVKVLDGCGINDHQWVFSGGLTDVAVIITTTDTWTGEVRTFERAGGAPFSPLAEIEAFSGCDTTLATAAPPIDPSSNSAVGTPAPGTASAPETTELLLLGDRFRVTGQWSHSGGSGSATGVPITSNTGYLWFFDADNVELLIKVLDGCAINDRVWVLAGGLTDVGVEVVVEDTLTGERRTLQSDAGGLFESVLDTSAFDVCDSLSP
jgi:photosystem II stability/assembly factor-like uncharacterized protein